MVWFSAGQKMSQAMMWQMHDKLGYLEKNNIHRSYRIVSTAINTPIAMSKLAFNTLHYIKNKQKKRKKSTLNSMVKYVYLMVPSDEISIEHDICFNYI